MGRTPCCEKMGLKKGPWTAEEDIILVNFITRQGHGNWRALPKRAGLLRCGKSCRLRWMNYLRPDIKRGSFTREEEETIIALHQELGNKWSVMATRLPGRTDNEIKNVWNTHLKKRVARNPRPDPKPQPHIPTTGLDPKSDKDSVPNSPAHSSSSVTTTCTAAESGHDHYITADKNFLEMDESFWSEVFSANASSEASDFSTVNDDLDLRFRMGENLFGGDLSMGSGMNFWLELLNDAEELTGLMPAVL